MDCVTMSAIYYLGDANFNVTTLVNTGGDALERYVYSPYGVLTIYDATWANVRSTSSYANAYTYTGRQFDAEQGLYHYRARFYAAQLGRFCSRDPVGYEAEEWNLCEYVVGDPISWFDPFGFASVTTEHPLCLTRTMEVSPQIYIYRIVNGVGYYDVGEFKLSVRVTLLCGNCDPNTGKLSEVAPEINLLSTRDVSIYSGWTCRMIDIRTTIVAVNPVVETVENGYGCHIGEEVGVYRGGTFTVAAKVKCSPKWSLFKKGFTWMSSWSVQIPDMSLECCPDYAPYQVGDR